MSNPELCIRTLHKAFCCLTKILEKSYDLIFTFKAMIWNGASKKINGIATNGSSCPEVFIGKAVMKICSKFTGEYPYRSVISVKLQSNFIEITLRHGCSPVNLLLIFRIPFLKKTSGWLLLNY